MPQSLRDALMYHVLAVAIVVEYLQVDDVNYLSMMVHPDNTKKWNKKFKTWIDNELKSWRKALSKPEGHEDKVLLYENFERIFPKAVEYYDESERPSYDEWNCGPEAKPNIYENIVQFRASGIRVKLPTYSPALNLVGTQVPILPWVKIPAECLTDEEPQQGRYMTVREAAKLQGMKDLSFGNDEFSLSTTRIFEALGNAVRATSAATTTPSTSSAKTCGRRCWASMSTCASTSASTAP